MLKMSNDCKFYMKVLLKIKFSKKLLHILQKLTKNLLSYGFVVVVTGEVTVVCGVVVVGGEVVVGCVVAVEGRVVVDDVVVFGVGVVAELHPGTL